MTYCHCSARATNSTSITISTTIRSFYCVGSPHNPQQLLPTAWTRRWFLRRISRLANCSRRNDERFVTSQKSPTPAEQPITLAVGKKLILILIIIITGEGKESLLDPGGFQEPACYVVLMRTVITLLRAPVGDRSREVAGKLMVQPIRYFFNRLGRRSLSFKPRTPNIQSLLF